MDGTKKSSNIVCPEEGEIPSFLYFLDCDLSIQGLHLAELEFCVASLDDGLLNLPPIRLEILLGLCYKEKHESGYHVPKPVRGSLTGNTDYTRTRIVKGFVNKKYLDIG